MRFVAARLDDERERSRPEFFRERKRSLAEISEPFRGIHTAHMRDQRIE